MKKLTTLGIAVLLGISGIAQTVNFEKGEKTVEVVTPHPKKWFKEVPKKIVVVGMRLNMDTQAGATMSVKLKGLNQNLMNEIGQQLYADFKQVHEALGFQVSKMDVSKLEADKKFIKDQEKGKVDIKEGQYVDNSGSDRRGNEQFVTIYPKGIPYLYVGNNGTDIQNHFANPAYLRKMEWPLGSDAIFVMLDLDVHFINYSDKTGALTGTPSLHIDDDSQNNLTGPNGNRMVYVSFSSHKYPKIGVVNSQTYDKGHVSVEEEDFGELREISRERLAGGDEMVRGEIIINPDKSKTYVNALLKAYVKHVAEEYKAFLDECNR